MLINLIAKHIYSFKISSPFENENENLPKKSKIKKERKN